MCRGQREKIISVAGEHDRPIFHCVGKDLLVIRFGRHHLGDRFDLVAMTTKRVRELARDVMVEEKPHAAGFSICGSASDSISERWSS